MITLTLLLLAASGAPFSNRVPAIVIPTYTGVDDPEIAGAASIPNIETLDAALSGDWRGRPIGLLAATSEGWAWTIPGLSCDSSKDEFVQVILDGDAIVVNRALMEAINQHNNRLEVRGALDDELGCKPMQTIF
ncbi:hypothetical protein BZG35_13465 [Brevundimonas sp. LM2]|uniref:hypothetical protein n=1 Tax=Brevundimonas sp. LM2 TaxID=1938605 RepID=UPI000983C7F1|nr:hypothetical protein [Brevundimonas sp. LM2]AQR62539.1 hypothetical protein BZG35_13465 [Brevundimonas sp. LM2]